MPADPSHRIQVLSDHVCNKIAAGEVIERPASVFKELVENAVDAGADRIEVEVLQGGRKAVIVTDNGHGMDRESALLAIERHATSKIRDVDDIESIDTMGFRGEALAAISAVSRFLLVTRREEDLSGTRVELDGGTMRNVEETGCPTGTRIE
ncbi:MAG: DNA mismatch repair endonuclease MutL, partial [Kiritimatiellae bacterium]|nr:DNA mismatch repair endonuclease MutL [Kiritimatiellia bacterium]